MAAAFGIGAGLLGLEHGFFETVRGSTASGGLVIHAIGPVPAATVWHGCELAFTVIPSFLGTGIAAMILGAANLAWATAFVHRPHGGLVLLLAVALFLAGGGFTTFRFRLLAGIAGTQAGAPLTGRTRVGPRLSGLLARLWPWLLIASLAWAVASWVIAATADSLMLRLTPAVTAATPSILVLILLSALGHDVQQARAASNQAARC